MVKTVRNLWRFLTSEKLILIYAFLIFSLLLARDPFSERTLIPNLEPYPDTFHYLVPATSFVSGNGFGITRGFGTLKPGVPPLYSIAHIPLFILKNDVRMFYFTNVLLSLASLYLFYLILKKLTHQRWIIGLSLLLFSTNYYLYWYPQWAMAENLLLPLFLAGLYVLLSKVALKSMIAASLVAIAMYLTKFAAAPIGLFYILIYSVKIFVEKKEIKKIMLLFLFLCLFGIPVLIFIYFNNNINHVQGFFELILKIFPGFFGSRENILQGANDWMSTYFLIKNFPRYLKATFGSSERLLWDFTPILPRYLAVMGHLGLVIGVLKKKTRLICLSLIGLLVVQMLFVSTFYAVDMRYLYTTIPTLILGVAMLFVVIQKARLLPIIIVSLVLFYSASNALRIKNQIMLNLRHAEVPWYYKSVLVLNDYFNKHTGGEKPIIISSVPPYLIDYYSNDNYDVLPLSLFQDFRNNRELVWGRQDYSNLHGIYKSYLEKGRELYVSTYGLGNDDGLHIAFADLEKNFILKEVYEGCYTQCKIYSLLPK